MKLRSTFATCLVLVFTSVAAFADPPKPAGDADIARLEQAGGHSVKWNYVPAGKTDRYGHAEVLITAPVSYVRDLILDFPHYKDFSSGKFKTSHLIDKTPTSTDLYIQVPVMHGMVMLWEVLRFGTLRAVGPGTEVLEGNYVRGNVKTSNVVFTMRAVGDRTVLKADIDVTPDFEAPQTMVDEELRDAAQNAVDAVQSRAQQKYAQWVASNTPPAPVTPIASSTPSATPSPQSTP